MTHMPKVTKKKLALYPVLVLVIVFIYTRFIEPNRIKIETVTIQSEKFAKDFPGLKIVQLSDLHMKQMGKKQERIVAMTNNLNPDLIAITGDFIYHNIAFESPKTENLLQTLNEITKFCSQLKARYGVWAIRGNNEFSNDKEISNEFLSKMKAAGIRVLANQRVQLKIAGTPIYLLGTDYTQFDEDMVADFYVEKQDTNNYVYYAGYSEKNSYSHFYRSDTTLWQNYIFTGRMMINTLRGGIGVTFYSQFDRGYDKFYRLRRYQQEPNFHFSPHGTKLTGGNFDTGIAPECDTWYWFKIKVETRPARTLMKAKIWQNGRQEPVDWQAVAFDDSTTRIKNGAVGLWSAKHGHHCFDDLKVINFGYDGKTKLLMQEDFNSHKGVGRIEGDVVGWVDYSGPEEAISVVAKGLPDSVFKILLVHSPDLIHEAVKEDIDLVLTGHTHGGQICIPLYGAPFTQTELGRKYAGGLFRFGRTWLYVNRGLGTIFIPLRFLSPPEITVINLIGVH